MVSVFDTAAAILAGFVVVPSAFSGGVDIESAGPSLVFNVMTDIFDRLAGGRFIGACFFPGDPLRRDLITVQLL